MDAIESLLRLWSPRTGTVRGVRLMSGRVSACPRVRQPASVTADAVHMCMSRYSSDFDPIRLLYVSSTFTPSRTIAPPPEHMLLT